MGFPQQKTEPRAGGEAGNGRVWRRVGGSKSAPTLMAVQERPVPNASVRGGIDALGDELGFSIGGALKGLAKGVAKVAAPVAKVAVNFVPGGGVLKTVAQGAVGLLSKPKAPLPVPEVAPPPPPPPPAAAPANVKAAHARATRSPFKGAAVNDVKRPLRAGAGGVPPVRIVPPPAAVAVAPAAAPAVLIASETAKGSSDAAKASKLLAAGAAAKRKSQELAKTVRTQSAKLDKVKAALAAAKEAGNATGATQLAQQAAQLESFIGRAQQQSETVARTAEQYGAAAQGAAAGAVAGAGAETARQGFGDFIKSPAGIATGVVALGAVGYALTRKKSS